MYDYLLKKYDIYSKSPKQKQFTFEHISEELLCSPTVVKMYIKSILNKQYKNLTFE